MAGGLHRFKGKEHRQGAKLRMVMQIRWGNLFPILAHSANSCDTSQTFSYHRAWIYWTGQKPSIAWTLEIHFIDSAIKRKKLCLVRLAAFQQVCTWDHAIFQRTTLLLDWFPTDSNVHRAVRTHASLWLSQDSHRLHKEILRRSGWGGNLAMVHIRGKWKREGV